MPPEARLKPFRWPYPLRYDFSTTSGLNRAAGRCPSIQAKLDDRQIWMVLGPRMAHNGKRLKGTVMCEVEGSLVGKLVFFERIDKDGKPVYGTGERLVIRETSHVCYCVKLGGGFNSHELYSYPKIGVEAWKVISVCDGTKEAIELAADLERFVKERPGTWVESVYTGAKNVARQIRAMLADAPVSPEPVTINVKAGQTIVLVVQ